MERHGRSACGCVLRGGAHTFVLVKEKDNTTVHQHTSLASEWWTRIPTSIESPQQRLCD